MDNDITPLEQIEESLWLGLRCQCDNCQVTFDLPEFDSIMEVLGPIEWAKAVAPLVLSKGWSVPDHLELLCPQCTHQKSTSTSTPPS